MAIPSPPAGSLVPGLPLPQARRSREMTPPSAAHRSRRSREMTPPSAAQRARRSREMTPPSAHRPRRSREDDAAVRGSPRPAVDGRSRHQPAADSMPAGRRPAGSPLTHARRPPLTLVPWIQSTSRPGVPCHVPRVMVFKSCLALRNSFNVSFRSCPWRLVWGRRLFL